MRLGTHLLAGWAVANGVEALPGKGLDAHGRRLVVLASLAPFLDGIHVFWNQRRFIPSVRNSCYSLVLCSWGVEKGTGIFFSSP